MGEIFLAEDELLGRKVAVKLLAEHLSRDKGIRKRFTREALTAAKLSGHPHIVTIYDVGEWNDRPFIVMEYLPGGTLGERARKGRLEHRQVIGWLRDAADALDDAHEAGIVHRDVKPANLLLDARGSVQVADFGIARVVDETTGMTAAGTVMGTAGYLSPEQARGEPATAASDRYALAVVAYELLTGGRPFERGSATAEAAAHVNEPVPPASSRGVGVPAAVDVVFDRALAKDPSARYRTSEEFVRELCRALGLEEEATRVLPAVAATVPQGRPRSRADTRKRVLPVLIGLLLALGAAGAVLASVLTGGDDKKQPPRAKPHEVTITRTVTGEGETNTVTVTTPTETAPSGGAGAPSGGGSSSSLSLDQAIALTDQATYRMRAGAFDEALPLALRAYSRLRGTGHIYEAYSAYDAGRSYAELGECSKALPLLDHAERIEGQNSSIDAARAKCQ